MAAVTITSLTNGEEFTLNTQITVAGTAVNGVDIITLYVTPSRYTKFFAKSL